MISSLIRLSAAAVAMVIAISPAVDAGSKKKSRSSARRVVVGRDAKGDWGANVDSSLNPIGDALGQDLVLATLGSRDGRTIDFSITVNALPENSSVSAATTYSWQFQLGEEHFVLTNCDVARCSPEDSSTLLFELYRCSEETIGGTTVRTCDELITSATAALVADKGLITIPIDAKTMGARAGGTIVGEQLMAKTKAHTTTNDVGTPFDRLLFHRPYKIPRRLGQ